MKYLQLLLIILFLNSCVPLSIAPKIEDYKVLKATKFKRKLPNQTAFVFNDPKKADEFYQFIDAKLGFENQLPEGNIPFKIEEATYFLSFYEVERTSKTLNLVPILIDIQRASKNSPMLNNLYTSRKGEWYIVITITSIDSMDCLNQDYKNKNEIVSYLKDLKEEYLGTQNYVETLLKR